MSEVLLKLRAILKQEFAWVWVSIQPCLIEHLAYPCRLFFYVFTIYSLYLVKVNARDFVKFRTSQWRDHSRAGDATIFLDDCTTCLLLSY